VRWVAAAAGSPVPPGLPAGSPIVIMLLLLLMLSAAVSLLGVRISASSSESGMSCWCGVVWCGVGWGGFIGLGGGGGGGGGGEMRRNRRTR